ncbi:Pycsar system effector family protein [Kitasatospora sp. NPDC088548]|uniref:Pycsar system effector family protein n=1 Tax=Kitasatospora sp. NPDC088548 TaxID=3364075 RepID=UPI003820AF15
MDTTTATETGVIDQALDREISATHADIARTDSKAGLVLTIDGVLVAAVAALGKAPAYAVVPAAIGTVSMIAAAVLAVLVVKPRLDSARTNGFSRWAGDWATDPEQILLALAEDVRPHRLHALSVLCERKMRLLIWACRLSVVAVVTVATAALLTLA